MPIGKCHSVGLTTPHTSPEFRQPNPDTWSRYVDYIQYRLVVNPFTLRLVTVIYNVCW